MNINKDKKLIIIAAAMVDKLWSFEDLKKTTIIKLFSLYITPE